MKRKFLLIFILSYVTARIFTQSLESHWTLVLAGSNLTDPVFWNRCIFTAGEDKAVTCISSKGSFLWRCKTNEYPGRFISVSPAGVVCLISAKGNIEAFSPLGMQLWHLKLPSKPIFPVYAADDGRLFVLLKNKIICLTSAGKIKWQMALHSSPAQQPSETGNGSVILVLKDGTFLHISIFGEIIEQWSLKKEISCIGKIPRGYVLACTDKSITHYKIDAGSEIVRQISADTICKTVCYADGRILYVFENGRILYKNIKSNETLWESGLGQTLTGVVKCSYYNHEFSIISKGFGGVITDTGKLKWVKVIPEKDFLPVITENGLLIGIEAEILNAYRVEAKLLSKNEIRKAPDKTYNIVETKKQEPEIPLYIAYPSVKEFLDEIRHNIEKGALEGKEPLYAVQLSSIFQNAARSAYFQKDFSPFERSYAAELLGKLGSYEYRDILLLEAKLNQDPTIAAGILRAFGTLVYDPDGKTIEAVKILIKGKNAFNEQVLVAACDTLEAFAKSSSKISSTEAIKTLFLITNGYYSDIIKSYAGQKIKNIIK